MNKFLREQNEILLALYMTIFSLMKPILISVPEKSTIILTFTIAILIGIWILCELIRTKTIRISIKYAIFILIVYLVILGEMIFRKNNMLGDIVYKFSIYGAIPILLSSKITDYKKLLWAYAMFSVINGAIYFFDPLKSYSISGNYMDFGFCQMLPAFAGSMIIFFIFKKKYGIILGFVFFVQMFLYANKGATICALCLLMVSYIFLNKENSIIIKRLCVIIFILAVMLFNLKKIVELLIELIKNLNMETYSLVTFLNILQNNGNEVYHSRTDIWEKAICVFRKRILLGNGIGYFEAQFNGYTHNFLLDIAVSSGLVGIIVILTMLFFSIKRVVKLQDNYKKYFLMIMFVLAFVPMMFSLTYWTVMPFWIYFATVFCSKK